MDATPLIARRPVRAVDLLVTALVFLLADGLAGATIRWRDEGKLLVRRRFVKERCIETESFGKARVAILAHVAETERAAWGDEPVTVWIDSASVRTRLELRGLATKSRSWFKKKGRSIPDPPAEGRRILWTVLPSVLRRELRRDDGSTERSETARSTLSFLPAVIHVENQNGRPPRRVVWIERDDCRIKLLLRAGKVGGTWVFPRGNGSAAAKQAPRGKASPRPASRPVRPAPRPVRPAPRPLRPASRRPPASPATSRPPRGPGKAGTLPHATGLRRLAGASRDRAEALRAAGDAEGAVAMYRALLGPSPRDPDLWAGLGGAFLDAGRLDKAGNAFRLALKFHPDHRDALEGLGVIQAWTGDAASALETLGASLRRGASARGYRTLAWVHLGLGRWDDAARNAENALSILPGDGLAAFHLARAEEARGRHDRAQALYRLATGASPASSLGRPDVLYRPRPASAPLRPSHPLSRALGAAGEERDRPASPLSFWAHFGLGCLLYEAGDPLSALEAFSKASNQWPTHRATRLNLTRCLLDTGRIAAAADGYRLLLAERPSCDVARRGLRDAQERLLSTSPAPAPAAAEKEDEQGGLDALYERVKARLLVDEEEQEDDDAITEDDGDGPSPGPSLMPLRGLGSAPSPRPRPASPREPSRAALVGLGVRDYHAPFSDEDYGLRTVDGTAWSRLPRLVHGRDWDLDPSIEAPRVLEGEGPVPVRLRLVGWMRPAPTRAMRVTASLERVGSSGAILETEALVPAGRDARTPVDLNLRARIPAFRQGTLRLEIQAMELDEGGEERVLLRRAYGLRYEPVEALAAR